MLDSLLESAKLKWPLFNGPYYPQTWLYKGQYPKTAGDFDDWAKCLIAWSENPANRRITLFATHLRFDWHRMYKWDDVDKKGVWREALAIANENVCHNREMAVGQEGGVHQVVYNKTVIAHDKFLYEHVLADRKALLEAQEGRATIEIVLPDLRPADE